MTTAIAIFACAALATFFVGVILLFRVGKRKVGMCLIIGGISMLLLKGYLAEIRDKDAQAAGFSNFADYSAAKGAGFADAVTYHAAQDAANARELAQARAAEEMKLAAAKATQAAAEAEQRKKASAEAACPTDLQCWGQKNIAKASGPCANVVERLAKNNFQWIDKWYETKFDHFRWGRADKSVITFIGDHIQYQNGFGAWITHTYECDFDTKQNAIINARAHEGRLPQ